MRWWFLFSPVFLVALAAEAASPAKLGAPYFQPFQYVGMSIAQAAKATGGKPNEVGNIVIDSPQAHMLLEADGKIISYADVELKQTAPCSLTRPFDSAPILAALGMKAASLDFARASKRTIICTTIISGSLKSACPVNMMERGFRWDWGGNIMDNKAYPFESSGRSSGSGRKWGEQKTFHTEMMLNVFSKEEGGKQRA